MNGARSCASITRSSFSPTATTRPTWPTPADGRTPAASSRPSPASSAPHPAATESATRPAPPPDLDRHAPSADHLYLTPPPTPPPPDLDRHAPSAEHLYLSPARTSALLANGSRPARWVTSGHARGYMVLGVCRPLTEVGRIRIQYGCCTAMAHGCRPRRVNRWTSASASTTSARPGTTPLHPDWVCSL